jgi:hypothetical protein
VPASREKINRTMTAIAPLDQAQESAVPSLAFGSYEGRLWYCCYSLSKRQGDFLSELDCHWPGLYVH